MKVAVVTDNGETISHHFGRARYYAVFTIENGAVVKQEQIAKPGHHDHDHGHHHHDDHDHGHSNVQMHGDDHDDHEQGHGFGRQAAERHADMFAPVQDCEAVITRGMGRGAYVGLQGIGVKPVVSDIPRVEDAVQAYINGTLTDHPEKLH
jgi:predicted Fe-Mo cluster-binding NifX family protein